MGISVNFESNSIFSIEPYLVDEKPTELSSTAVRPKFVIFPNHIRDHQILKNVFCVGRCQKPWQWRVPSEHVLCDCSFHSPETTPRIGGGVGVDYFDLCMGFIRTLEVEKTFSLSMKLEDISNRPFFIEQLRQRFRKVHAAFYRNKRKNLSPIHWYEERQYPQYWMTRVQCPENDKRTVKYRRMTPSRYVFQYPMGQ